MSIGTIAKQRTGDDGRIKHGVMPQSGTHVVLFDEGFSVNFSENSGFFSIRIPLKVSGDDETCPEAKWSVFITSNPDYEDLNKRQLAELLAVVGLAEKFDEFLAKQGFDPETPIPNDEEKLNVIVNALATQLMGKPFEAILEVVQSNGKDKEGNDRKYTNVYFRELGPIGCGIVEEAKGANTSQPAPSAPTPSPAPKTSGGTGSGW